MAEKSLKELSDEGHYDLTGEGMGAWKAKYSAGDKMWFINTDGVVKKKSDTFTFSVETAIAMKGGHSLTVNFFTFRFTTTAGIDLELKTPAVLSAEAGVTKIDIHSILAQSRLSENGAEISKMKGKLIEISDKLSELESEINHQTTEAFQLNSSISRLQIAQMQR